MQATTAALPALDAQQQRALRDDGFLVLRDAVPLAAVAALRRRYAERGDAIAAELRREGAPIADAAHEPDERRFAVATAACRKLVARFGRGWRRDVACGAIWDLQTAPRLLDAVATMLGDEIYAHATFNARPKLPDQELTTVPWHQDAAYFGPAFARLRVVTAWLPLVPVDARNGCLQVAAGSHRYGLMPHHVDAGEGGFLELTGGAPRPDVVVTCVMAPGDALIFDQLMWHRSLPNASDHVRWSIDLRYYADPAIDGKGEFPRPWVLRHPTLPPLSREEWLEWVPKLVW